MKSSDKKALLRQLRADWKTASDWWEENRKNAIEAIKFRVPGGQWDAKIKKEREDAGLPCIESDKINQYIRQVVNDGRQNRPSVKVSPVEGGDTDVAEAYAGLIRSICDRSNADEAFDTALEHAAGSGYGFFRVLTKPVRDKSFLQELIVRRVGNPLAVMLSPHFLADGSDSTFGFVIDEIPKDKYKKQYPKAKETNWNDDAYTGGWVSENGVRIVEYYYKVEETVTMHLLETGEEVSDEEYQKAIMEGITPPKIAVDADGNVMTRDFTVERVKWCRASGAEILEENTWVGKYIPIVPVYGNELNVEGKIILYGLVRPAMDPQRLYNFSRSAFAQRVGMTPKTPWLAAAGQIEGHEDKWEVANTGTHQVLTYNVVDVNGTPVPPPQRIQPTDVPAGFQQDMELAEHDIQASMGMYSASIGERSNEKSGRAIMARQREGDTATFHYQDNLNRAIRYLGRILVDAIPKVIDSKRGARILGEDGAAQIVDIDPEQKAPVQKIRTPKGIKTVYNLNAGTYDISISAGPSYTTKRQESAEAMIELTRANPTMWQTHGDLIVKAQDWPNSDEFAKRSKMTLPPELREDEESENPEAAAAEAKVKQVIEQATAAIEEREAALQQQAKEIEALKQQLANKAGEVAVKSDEAETKQYEAETERIQALAPAITPETISAIVAQTVAEIMKQPVPMEPEPPPMLEQPIEQPPPGGFFTPEEGM